MNEPTRCALCGGGPPFRAQSNGQRLHHITRDRVVGGGLVTCFEAWTTYGARTPNDAPALGEPR